MQALFICTVGRQAYEKSINIDFAPTKGMVVVLPVGRAVVDYAGLDFATSATPFWYITLKPLDRDFVLDALNEKLLRNLGWNHY